MRREDAADAEHAVLLAAFYDVARLNEDVPIAGILDRKLADLPGLTHDDGFVPQRLFECQRHRTAARRAINEIDREIAVADRLRQSIAVGTDAIGLREAASN